MSVRTIEIPMLAVIRQVDPEFDAARRRELAYQFDGFGWPRRFFCNPMTSGAYGDTRNFLLDENRNPILDEFGEPILIDGPTLLNTESGQNIATDGGLKIVVE